MAEQDTPAGDAPDATPGPEGSAPGAESAANSAGLDGTPVPEVSAKTRSGITAKPIRIPGVHEEDDSPARPREHFKAPKAFQSEDEPPPRKARAEDEPEPLEEMDREKLIKQLQTLRGMHKGLLAKAEGGDKKVRAEAEQAWGTARAWKQHAESLEARIAELESRAAAGGNGKSTPEPADPVADSRPFSDRTLDSIDWDEYQKIAAKYGQATADIWKDKQVLGAFDREIANITERLRAEFDSRLAPTEEEQGRQAMIAGAQALFGSVAEQKFEDGDLAYPELHDRDSAEEITRIWLRAGFPENFMAQPISVHFAVTAYRDILRFRARQGNSKTLEEQPATTAEIDRAIGGVATAGDIGSNTAARPRTDQPLRVADIIRRDFLKGSEADKHRAKYGFDW